CRRHQLRPNMPPTPLKSPISDAIVSCEVLLDVLTSTTGSSVSMSPALIARAIGAADDEFAVSVLGGCLLSLESSLRSAVTTDWGPSELSAVWRPPNLS